MPDRESRYPQDWFRKAKKDLERVSRRLKGKDIEDASIHLQFRGYTLLH